MKTSVITAPGRFQLDERKADRLGVAASVLCAIHCALAPVLLIALPTFGKIWAHPASHALVAIFIVPLAAFSILKGFRKHGKRWVLLSAVIGIFFVLGGAALPAFTKASPPETDPTTAQASATEPNEEPASCEEGCEDCCESCDSETSEKTVNNEAGTESCVDGCCPSIQVSETGETSLHIPPAAIITTLGGVFLIAAHIGNLRLGAGCFVKDCQSCEASDPARDDS